MAEAQVSRNRARQTVAIFLVSLAGLLLEVGYTRIVSLQALVLLHVPRHRSGAARHRIRRHLRRPVQAPPRDGHRADHRHLLDLRRDQHRRRVPRDLADPGRHAVDLGLRHQGVVQELRHPRDHLLRDLRLVHRARDHRLDDPRARARRRHRPALLRGPHRRRPRLPRRDPADHLARPARRDHGLGARSSSSSACSRCRAGSACSWASARRSAIGLLLDRDGVVSLPDVRTEDTKAGPENAAYSRLGPGVPRRRALRAPADDPRRAAAARRHVRLGDAQVRRQRRRR